MESKQTSRMKYQVLLCMKNKIIIPKSPLVSKWLAL